MHRFKLNRSWTLIPALWLSLVLLAASVSSVGATRIDAFDDGGTTGGGAAPANAGDPDGPGATKAGPGRSAGGRLGASGNRIAGDNSTAASDWKWRLQVVLRGTWKLSIHF